MQARAASAAASTASASSSSAMLSAAWKLMRDFARRTGLIGEDGAPLPKPMMAASMAAAAGASATGVPNARRYLWTDAFATCNFLSFARTAPAGSAQASTELHLATTTIHHVHAVLASWRADEAHRPQRKGWLRSAHEGGLAASEEHPTRAGLRIGKKLPEVVPMASTSSAVASAALDDWDRDGQYFHYLTKHMHALDQTARVLRKPLFNLWARELADAAHRAFVYHSSSEGMSIHWKMSTDLSRPVVTGAGSHDAIDGLITAVQLQHTAKQMAGDQAELEGPMLEQAIADYTTMVGGSDISRWVTTDSLGIGGLLMDAARVEQIDRMRKEPMSVKPGRTFLEMLLAASVHSLLLFQSKFDPRRDADSRLAFRELGLAIGLAGVERMVEAKKAGKFSGNASSAKALEQLARFVPLRAMLSTYWSATDHQRVSTWTDHEDINATMLATALAPEGFLDIEFLAPAEIVPKVATQKEEPAAAAMVDEEKKEAVTMASEMKVPSPQPPAQPTPAAAPFTPAPARAQPPIPEANLQHLRRVAMPVDVEAILAAEARIPQNPIGDPALSVANRPAWLTALINSIGDARVVMIGEASHGTEEFYRVRAYITQHLLMHHGFDFVAVEGDFPDVYSIQRYVTDSDDRLTNAGDALASFGRFPRWMWANHATRDFIEWMRGFNREKRRAMQATQAAQEPAASVSQAAPPSAPLAGMYGLDLYSMFTSADEVINYLDQVNPSAADHARDRYSELDNFREEPSEYGIAVACGLVESQQQAVVSVLVDMVRRSHDYLADSGFAEGDELVAAKLNALVVKDAEKYYRASLQGGHVSWNQRDAHFKDVLLTLLQIYSDRKREALGKAPQGAAAERALATTEKETVGQILRSSVYTGDDARAIVWAHNSHVGDARATAREEREEWNIGQLVREKLGQDATFNIGFSTYTGTVSAARRWGGERETMNVRPGLPDGYEQLFHEVAARVPVAAEAKPNFMYLLRSNDASHSKVDAGAFQLLRTPSRLQRAIGVQYVPATERQSHYFRATLPRQFDAMLHFDTTHALQPLAPATPAQRAKLEDRKRKEKSQAPLPPESEEDEDALQD